MAGYQVSAIASQRVDDIFAHTREAWGQAPAEACVQGLFDCFDRIARRDEAWRVIPAAFGVDGYYRRHAHHYICWRQLEDGAVGIVAILHGRMHLMDRLHDDTAP